MARSKQWGIATAASRLKPTAQAGLLLLVPAITLISVGVPVNGVVYGMPFLVSFPLTVFHCAAIMLALLRPRFAAVAAPISVFLLAAFARDGLAAPWPVSVTTLLTQIVVILVLGLRANWSVGLSCWLGGIAASAAAAPLFPRGDGQDEITGNIVLLASISGGLLALAVVVREWQQIRSQLVRERELSAEEHAKRVLVEEKTRIARELHDVIAHSMSIINVQATTARYRYPDIDPALAGEFDEMAASSRRALTEMRGLLGVLRDEEVGGELAPQPGLARIPQLIENAQRAGMSIEVHGLDVLDGAGGSDIAGVAAFRIVQEALSNATRHAPGAGSEVHFGRADGELTIAVRNDAPASGQGKAGPGGGHGLVGMQERAAMVGGAVRFGGTGDGGFEVRAVLPLDPGGNGVKERQDR